MTLERDYKPIEIPQAEPLIIIRNQELFPFAGLQLPEDRIGHFDYASQDFMLKGEDEAITGRFMYQDVLSNGNTGMFNIPFLPERYYALGTTEDDLRHHTETYPDAPQRRVMFTAAFDLPRPLDPDSEFRNTTRIRVSNHLTGKTFYAVEARAEGGYDRTRSLKEDHYAILYKRYYYEGQQWDDRINRHAHIDISLERSLELSRQMAEWEEDNTKPFPQELPDAYKRARELDDEHSYLNPFRLSFVVEPNITRHIGVTIEKVPVGSVDLSVNTSDQVIHGH